MQNKNIITVVQYIFKNVIVKMIHYSIHLCKNIFLITANHYKL